MSADSQLEIAGLAAEALERMGFVSVARLRDGVVTLTFWKMMGGRQVQMQRQVTDADALPEVLAQLCAAHFRASFAPPREAS
jgi:hypothetical protein